jgi:Predicted membrane protein (DUF2207)
MVVGVALTLVVPAARAAEKSYDFPLVTIDATVDQNGSLRLVEQRTFDFHGFFTYAYFDIDWPPDRIEDFLVLEHGQPLDRVRQRVVRVDGKFRSVWTYVAQDERRTFTIEYTARCAVDVFADTAHLLWQFVGTGWSVPTEHLHVTVHVPGRAHRERRPATRCPQTTSGPRLPHDAAAAGRRAGMGPRAVQRDGSDRRSPDGRARRARHPAEHVR